MSNHSKGLVLSNGMSGEIRVELATSDPCDETLKLKPRTLYAYMEGQSCGDYSDFVILCEKEPGAKGDRGQMWLVPIKKMKALIALTEAAIAMGEIGFEESGANHE
jgi:hypothetical protein